MPVLSGSVVIRTITGIPESEVDILDKKAINGGDLAANGSAVEFDITGFINSAKIQQISMTQLTDGAANYTLEIWEKDASGYDPTSRGDLIYRVYSRTFSKSEVSDLIVPYLMYVDRDGSSELHCRLTNNIGGTASDFDISIKY